MHILTNDVFKHKNIFYNLSLSTDERIDQNGSGRRKQCQCPGFSGTKSVVIQNKLLLLGCPSMKDFILNRNKKGYF